MPDRQDIPSDKTLEATFPRNDEPRSLESQPGRSPSRALVVAGIVALFLGLSLGFVMSSLGW